MVTDVPITYLGYVNRDTGVSKKQGIHLMVEPSRHDSDLSERIWFNRCSIRSDGSFVQNKGPLGIINRDVCPLTLPACSLLDVPYGHGFVEDPCMAINDGDLVRFKREGDQVSIEVLERV